MSETATSESPPLDPFKIALSLVNGGNPDDVSPDKITPVIAALGALKKEYAMINPTQKKREIARITELVASLSQRVKPGHVQTKTATARRQTTSKPWPTSKRPPGVVAIKSLPDDEYDAIVERIERVFDGESFTRSELDPLTKRKVLYVIDELRKQQAEEANYDSVRDLDLLAAEITAPPKASLQQLRDDIATQKKNIDALSIEIDQLETQRSREMNDLMEQRHLELAALIEDQDIRMEEFCQNLPQLDGEVKFTGELLLMRANAKAYALGGDYNAARILHLKAEEKEEKERHDAVRRTLRTCNLRRDHFEKEQARQREVFNTRWDGIIANRNAQWEKVFARKQCQMNNYTTKLQELRTKLRKLTTRKKF